MPKKMISVPLSHYADNNPWEPKPKVKAPKPEPTEADKAAEKKKAPKYLYFD